MKQKITALLLTFILSISQFSTMAIASSTSEIQQQIENGTMEIIEGENNIENSSLAYNNLMRSVPVILTARLSVANTLNGIFMQTELVVSQSTSKVGAYNKLLQEKNFFGFTSKEKAPDHYHSNTFTSTYGHIFVYREVGKEYRVLSTQYYEYGGQTYTHQNQTPSFLFLI